MTPKRLVFLIAIGLEIYLAMVVVSEVGPHYTNGDIVRIMIATSLVYFFIGIGWGTFWMIEQEQIKREKLRDKIITALQSRHKDRISEAIDILNHPNGYPKNV